MLVGGPVDRVHGDPDDRVGCNVDLHAEVPDVPFLAAGHLGITLVLLVLRRVRRIDEACVDDPPRGQPQAGIKELLVDHSSI